MPELPELEALARAIAPPVCASPINGSPRVHFAVLKTATPAIGALAGERFTSVTRRAKYLAFAVHEELTLVVHLMSAGRIGYYPAGSKQPRAAVLEVRFADGGLLAATESGTRKAMRVGVYGHAGREALFAPLGLEPLSDAFDTAALVEITRRAPRQLNALLRDGRMIAGIGRAFADEILHAARLSPFAISTKLDADAVGRLYDAIRGVLAAAVETCEHDQGLALPARNTIRPLRIHGHAGEPCPRCATPMGFVDFEANRIVYCAACQTAGRVLADRRMSRLLK
jgi:formamidopyrimidine-DNA glycosylase